MRFGFDVSPLHRPHPPGVVRATRGLVEALEARGRHAVVRLAPPAGRDLLRWRQLDLPALERAQGLDGIHSPVSAFPLRGAGARVQTIHELPWLHGVDENAGWRHRAWARFGPRRARRVLTPTAFVARDLEIAAAVGSPTVIVAPWGVDAVFGRAAREFERAAQQLDRVAQTPRGDYVLAPGGGRAKKNLAALVAGVEAHARRTAEGLRVVVTGELDAATAALVERSRGTVAIECLPWLDDAGLAALLSGARAVAVLSLSEGFGFPVLEALAAGTPAIVPLASAQAEVAGAAGILVDARDPESVARGLAQAGDRPVDRARLRARAAEFTWDACAAIVERAWEESV